MKAHFLIFRCAVVTLIALTLSLESVAFCGEINGELDDAIHTQELGKLKALLKDNPNYVFATNSYGQTPLELAAFYGYKDMAELLVTNKADVNAKDIYGGTPLQCAAKYGHIDVVELLLANKANINVKDNNNKTPLALAVSEGNKDMAELLRQHGGKE